MAFLSVKIKIHVRKTSNDLSKLYKHYLMVDKITLVNEPKFAGAAFTLTRYRPKRIKTLSRLKPPNPGTQKKIPSLFNKKCLII